MYKIFLLIFFLCCCSGCSDKTELTDRNSMIIPTKNTIALENFDDYWGILGDPVTVENKFHEFLPKAEELKDKSIYLQILSQIALAQALQKKFDEAHKTLDTAEKLLTPNQMLAQARILLERGRVMQQTEFAQGRVYKQSKVIDCARDLFKKSFKICEQHNFDYHAVNAAHMIAIVAGTSEEKIRWNKIALELAEKTANKRAKMWLGSLYNNLGRNYVDEKRLKEALETFRVALECRKKEGYEPNVRLAKCSVGEVLRLLGRLDEALTIQQNLIKDYDAVIKSNKLDMPEPMFKLARGFVYEELAEIYAAKTHNFSGLALKDLETSDMFKCSSPERIERLKQLYKDSHF